MQFPVPSETFASLEIETLSAQGHNISVYSMRFKHSKYDDLIKERGLTDIKVSHFSLGAFLFSLQFSFRHPLMVLSLFWWIICYCGHTPKHLFKSIILIPSVMAIFGSILRRKPNIVHLFWGHYPSMVGFLIKKYMSNTIVSQFLGAHDLLSAYPGSIQFSLNADLVFTHSRANLSLMETMGFDISKVHVIHRGIKLMPINKHALAKFKQESIPIFLAAGRLIEEKGFDDAIYTFAKVLEKYPSAVLYIAGDGPQRKYLELLASSMDLANKVIFIGHVCQTELKDYMSKAGFFLLMSRHPSERLPNVVKEAMYQRCIVVTTDTVGIDELIEHKVDGYIVKKNDIGFALNYLYMSLSDLEGALDIVDNAHQKMRNKFDVNMSMTSYLDLWQSEITSNNQQ
jgi:glycosyltransferase involved in cell wall biosynthesis